MTDRYQSTSTVARLFDAMERERNPAKPFLFAVLSAVDQARWTRFYEIALADAIEREATEATYGRCDCGEPLPVPSAGTVTMTNSPDTNPANVARVLRETAINIAHLADLRAISGPVGVALLDKTTTLHALADALERKAESGPTWEERVERASVATAKQMAHLANQLATTNEDGVFDCAPSADAILRAAFPELAPSDD